MRLTQSQIRFLESALEYTDGDEYDGVGAYGALMRTARSLERRGLIKYISMGPIYDCDANPDVEYPIYVITKSGRGLLRDIA